jgi:DNA-binding NtrC family response regulator
MNRVLMVDDEIPVLNALKRALRLHFGEGGIVFEQCSDPREALERLRATAFDVVLSDLNMPHMDGIAFLNQVAEIQPHAVRMILSGSTEVQSILKSLNQVGVFRYITKPWAVDKLTEHLLAALQQANQSRAERELADQMRVHRGELTEEEMALRRLQERDPTMPRLD